MNKINVNSARAISAEVRAPLKQVITVVEMLPERYTEIAEGVEEAFDIVDEASRASFPASDPPSWLPTQLGG